MEAVVLILHARDNVAVVLKDISKGQTISMPDGSEIVAISDIPYSHKVAVTDLMDGAIIYKYGEVIGKSDGEIKMGEWIHTHNMKE
ncbi:MAG: UxaA family hydrolase [Methylocystaceae bacterium]